jgi:DNA polymerase-3 subunit epsilon
MRLLAARVRNRYLQYLYRNKRLNPLAQINLAALGQLRLSEEARSHRYAVVDLETTGLDFNRDRILSLSAVRVAKGRIRLGEVFEQLVNPGRGIAPSSVKTHGIVPDMVAEARPIEEVFDDFLSFLGADIIVGHHVRFDLRFLNRVMRARHGFSLQNAGVDTALMCREIFLRKDPDSYFAVKDQHRYDLDSLAKRLGIDIYNRHTSSGDALATAMIFQRGLNWLEELGSRSLRNLLRLAGVF